VGSIAYLIPNILPIFACRPCFDVGIPVAFAIFRFAAVTPVARFSENDNPGIPVLLFFLGMIQSSSRFLLGGLVFRLSLS